MLNGDDKRIYFKMSFLEQMCWLQEEVESNVLNYRMENSSNVIITYDKKDDKDPIIGKNQFYME